MSWEKISPRSWINKEETSKIDILQSSHGYSVKFSSLKTKESSFYQFESIKDAEEYALNFMKQNS